MLRIRLTRVGKKRQAHFRVVVADIEAPRDGRIVERIGHYTPVTDPITYKIDEGRALYWLSVGAQPTDAVRRLLEKQGTYDRLSRLRAGESLDSLIAEYEGNGEPVAESGEQLGAAADVEEEKSPVEEAVDEVSEAAAAAAQAVSDVVDDVLGDEEE